MVLIGDNQKVASRSIERAGLTDAERKAAEEEFRAANPGDSSIPDKAYRKHRTRPLLVLQLTKLKPHKEKPSASLPGVVATWCISFPKPASYAEEKRVSFVVNTVWVQEHLGVDDADEEMDDFDD
jgi:hypothetical protein